MAHDPNRRAIVHHDIEGCDMFGKDESSRFPPVFYRGKWWACHVYTSPCSGTGGDTIANHLRIYRFKGCFGAAFLVSLPFALGSFALFLEALRHQLRGA